MRSRGWGPHERDERPWKRGPDGVASVSTTCGTQCEDGGLAARGGSRRRHTGQHPDLGLPAFGPEQQIPAGSAAPTPAFCYAAGLRLTLDSIRRSRGTRASPSLGPGRGAGQHPRAEASGCSARTPQACGGPAPSSSSSPRFLTASRNPHSILRGIDQDIHGENTFGKAQFIQPNRRQAPCEGMKDNNGRKRDAVLPPGR